MSALIDPTDARFPITDGLWHKFREQALPPDLPDHRLVELKIAFYAGALAIAQITHGTMQEQPILTVAQSLQELLRENGVFTEAARRKP